MLIFNQKRFWFCFSASDERELSLRILLSQQIEVFQVLLTSAIIKYIFLHHQTFNKMQENATERGWIVLRNC